MSDKQTFLNLSRLPARLTYVEAGWYLGATEQEIAIAVANKVLIPLGSPVQNARKFLALVDVERVAADRSLLNAMTKLVTNHWKKRNKRCRTKVEDKTSL